MKARFLKHAVSTFGFSVIQQALGLARHILIAAYFGISRDYDLYLIVYAMATYVIFNLSMAFDTVAVSRLVQIRERDGEDGFWKASNRILVFSVLGGALVSIMLVGLLYVFLPVIAAGFTDAERDATFDLVFSFLPWGFAVLPFYALSAHLKALWRFHWVFGAEILVMAVSIAVLWQYHDTIHALPFAYGAGYGAALLFLLACRGLGQGWGGVGMRDAILPGIAHQHLSNQLGSVVGLVDRFFQSHLLSGGISALGYAGQIVTNLSMLITFREIYVVPLSSGEGREEKLERVLKGVMLLSMPFVVFTAFFAQPVVRILFQRGNFTPEAAVLTADLVSILALSLVTTPIMLPLFRLFQILDRIAYSHAFYGMSLIGTAVFQYIFVFYFNMDVRGFAWAGIANSTLLTIALAVLTHRFGIVIRWPGILAYGAYSAIASILAGLVARFAAAGLSDWGTLTVGGAVFGVAVLIPFAIIHRRIRAILGLA